MHKEVRGRRRDLQRVREAERVTHLTIGSGLASLSGLERMQALESFWLEGPSMEDLGPLSAVTRLDTLFVDRFRGARDCSPLEALDRLTYLYVAVEDAEAARSLARVDFGRLRALEEVRLLAESLPRPVAIDLRPFATLPALELLLLPGFTPDPRGVQALVRGAPALRNVSLSADDALLRPLRERLGEDEVENDWWAGPPLGEVVKVPGDGRFSVGIDAAELWDVESNHVAEEILLDALSRRDPALLGRIEFDTENGAVWVDADRREDLEAVQRLVGEIAKARKRDY